MQKLGKELRARTTKCHHASQVRGVVLGYVLCCILPSGQVQQFHPQGRCLLFNDWLPLQLLRFYSFNGSVKVESFVQWEKVFCGGGLVLFDKTLA
jgi:hypothetical protein